MVDPDASKENVKEIEAQRQKLKLMEEELQVKCAEFDQREEDLSAQQAKLDTLVGSLNDSERFMKIQDLLNEVYTLFVSAGCKPEDLHESIRLILEARARFTSDS